ncbi:terminase TerL endonuclease subunit [Mesorhizobium sp. WSM2239]|uniref:Terminase TerL endonuclease subunit n=2 Tax=unclassified Mesorhizobium TaxID=325217 RepID=A0AAU8D3R7_9HYPH
MWDLSCLDWQDRIREGRSLLPEMPLLEEEARMGLQFFDELQLPDVPGTPKMRHAAGQWFRDIVRASFGSWDPVNRVRHIRDIFAMVPKGSSKTSYSAGLGVTAMLMNQRPRAEALLIGPTQAVSDRAYEQAVGMIEESADLKRRFRPRDHIKTIEDLLNKSELKVKTFDVNILTGSILFFALLDEIHLLGRSPHTTKVLRQIRGGLEKTPEGLLLITTTQSDEIPTGAFKDELRYARKIRDGEFRGKTIRPMLPILYEFPSEIASDPEQWQDPENWPMVMPNLGKSIHLESLYADWLSERTKGDHAIRVWASQHLNIEIGVGTPDDGWRGADYWGLRADPTLTLDELIRRSEVATVGIDGGGLDDLLGLSVIGREKETRRWLIWNHAFAHPVVLERRKDIASTLKGFEEERSLTFCEVPDDVVALVDIIVRLQEAGLLPAKNAIGLDPNNIATIIEELAGSGVPDEMLYRLRQGAALSPALWGLERKLSDGTAVHSGLDLMNWVVGNAKVEVKGNGNMITKQISGRAKIDPLIATFCAAILMSWNPEAVGPSVYSSRGILVL